MVEEHLTYTSNDGYNQSYFLWTDSNKCSITLQDSNLIYNKVEIYFPADQSIIAANCEPSIKYIDNNLGEIIDSIETCAWYFHLSEKDFRFQNNSFCLLYIIQEDSTLHIDTLYRKEKKLTILDKIPLPKLH